MDDVPTPEALFNRVTDFDFGTETDSESHVPTDQIAFQKEMEAAVLELQRKNNVQRNQFSSDFLLGREDDYHEEDAETHQTEDFNDFLNHLSDLNATNLSKNLDESESSDESDISDDEEKPV